MKRLLIVSFFLLSIEGFSSNVITSETKLLATPTYTYVQINKIRGGLFGYKSVTTGMDTNGNKITNCENPGKKKCKAEQIVIGGTTWTAEQGEELDSFVTAQLTPEHTSGTVLFKEQYVVTFVYGVESNSLTYNIYTTTAAIEAGISW